MTTRVTTPPAALAVSLDDVRLDLRAPDVALNDQIESLIDLVTGVVEGKIERALITRTCTVTLDRFDGAIRLDYPPTLAVQSLKFIDADGVQQTLDPQDYVVDAISEPGYIVPAPGKTWPETRDQINAVSVVYTCGYGASDTDVPKAIQGYIRARVVQLWSDPGADEGSLGAALDSFVVYA